MSPFFSIILPTYNRANFLPKAIESVLSQTHTSWELIIVDDGSTDNTKEIITEYKDERIKYIYQENAERSAARNNGIKNAKGEYICFLDSDDFYLPDHLHFFHEFILKTEQKCSLFFCNYRLCTKGKLEENQVVFSKKTNPYEIILLGNIASQRVCIHSSILKNNYFNESLNVAEDTELWFRIIEHYPFIYVDQATVVIVSHANRTIDRKNISSYLKSLEVKKKLAKSVKATLSKHTYSKVIHDSYFSLAQSYEVHHKFWNMSRTLLKASWYLPTYRWKEKVYMVYANLK
ncbi:glycosyltransferase family A protein [Flammeovirgaceae bacterium SG7u.111]|nr:glycosyltransferase family A protein [Flammeovirgaceae bacterium SG7u.132]WPO34979.1 glycosyltransferase family A protein [Flammeovirgaceae bacterium SG7u.111]